MDRVKRRRIPLAALALVAPLMLSSSTTESAAGEAQESGVAPLACEAPAAGLDHRIGTEVARIAGSGAPAGADTVVLNGRGYNYGHAEPGDLDRIQLEAVMKLKQARAERR